MLLLTVWLRSNCFRVSFEALEVNFIIKKNCCSTCGERTTKFNICYRQCKTIDLISAHKLLQTAAEDIVQLRGSFDAVLNRLSLLFLQYMEFAKTVFKQNSKENQAYCDEVFKGITLSNPKKRFCVIVFLLMMDILSCQLINRFKRMKSVVTSYQVLEPSFLSNASCLHLKIEPILITNFLITSLRSFLAQCSQLKRRLEKRLLI